MIEVFVPALLNSYLKTFRKAFSKSGYTYFVGFNLGAYVDAWT